MRVSAVKIRVAGRVQGVGFRPFIHRLAVKHRLKGYVRNLGGGEVEIWVEGCVEDVKSFLNLLLEDKPPPARIEDLIIEKVEPKGFRDFKILKSSLDIVLKSSIPPDLAVCRDCLEEVLEAGNRRYLYPFNSCAYCGPRYSYMESLPYDRENISMRDFPLCHDCLREYEDLWNTRRYDAKGISCPKCGPRLWLTDNEGREVDCEDALSLASKLIDEGYILGIKGLGGFHIACLASEDSVVLELRKRKKRPQKPFALMALNVDVAKELVVLSEEDIEVLESPEAPILLLPRRDEARVSHYVAPGLRSLGIMVAYTPLHYLLLKNTRDRFLIMTSGNPPGRPMCIDNDEAISKLGGIVDYFLLHNRRIVNRVDDSVVRRTYGKITFLRRGRGYAPEPLKLPFKLRRPVLSFGAELQNTGCIGFEEFAIPTQYIGDTDDYETLMDLKNYTFKIAEMYKLDLSDARIACDLHPKYLSSRLAVEIAGGERELIKVQHHYSHIASAMADYKHNPAEDAVGVAIDGAGYGLDGNIWGGEVIVYSGGKFYRFSHLEYHPLPGGDRSVLYPARMLASILFDLGYSYEEVRDYFVEEGLASFIPGGDLELRVTYEQWKKREVLTSSCGRLLDSISVLLKICKFRSYEGEPAIKLEEASIDGKLLLNPKSLELYSEDGKTVKTGELVLQILNLLDTSSVRDLGYTAQYVLGWSIGEAVSSALLESNSRKVYVSGGAAVNTIIYKGLKDRLDECGKRVELRIPRKIPPGDGGISLGQTYILGVLELYDKT